MAHAWSLWTGFTVRICNQNQFKIVHVASRVSLVVLVVGGVLVVVSVVLWLAVAFHVGLQDLESKDKFS